MLTSYFHAYAQRYQPYKLGAWCYEDGCVYLGLEALAAVEPDGPWFDEMQRLVSSRVGQDGTPARFDAEEFNIDNILAGRALFSLADRTGDVRYVKAIERLVAQLARHPRIPAGNYWHKLRYPHQVWLDGLYMGLPFQIQYGQRVGRADLVDDAVAQFISALKLTQDPETGLYMHGYDDARQQPWADPETGRSPTLWTRALGWMAMALVDTIGLIGPDVAQKSGLVEAANDFARRIRLWQLADGRWYQVTNRPDLEGNYAESSGTAMLAYFFLAGARLGLVDCDPAVGSHALDGLSAHALKAGADGALALHGICQVAGLGGLDGNYRDGTPAYYLSEPVVADDAKGTGPFMMAVAERRRAEAAGTVPVVRTA